jgi:hypothetical protein
LRGRVPYKGKFVKVDNIPTGEPIMLSTEEWQERSKRILKRNYLGFLVLFPLVVFPVLVGFILLMGETILTGTIITVAIYSSLFPFIFIIRYFIFARKGWPKGTYTGLFEHGLVVHIEGMPDSTFIPYRLIRDFHVKKGRFSKMLMIDIVGFKKPVPNIGLKALQDDGLEILRKMLFKRPEDPEAPELHVYGGRSAKVRSIPNMSNDADGRTKVS